MAPRNLCNSLLHKFFLGPSLGESSHVLEIAGRKALHLREGFLQIHRQTVYDLGAPVLPALAEPECPARCANTAGPTRD